MLHIDCYINWFYPESSETIDGNATIVITGLDCQESYTVMAAGLYNGTLVGPRTSHETITTGVCFMTINPSTVTGNNLLNWFDCSGMY